MNYKTNWTTVGTEYVPDDKTKSVFMAGVDALDWIKTEPGKTIEGGMVQVDSLSEMIKQFRIPNVKAVALYGMFGNLSMIGIEAQFLNGLTQIFAVTDGLELTPVMSRIDESVLN